MEGNTVVTGNFTIQANTKTGRMITMQGFTYAGDTLKEVNDRIDINMLAIDRQETKAELAAMKAVRESKLNALRDAKAFIQSQAPTTAEGGIKMATAVKAAVKNQLETIEGLQKFIADIELRITDAQKELDAVE